ncbi:MAG: P-loop NTPase fold protein [Gemmatimonadota bacterium]
MRHRRRPPATPAGTDERGSDSKASPQFAGSGGSDAQRSADAASYASDRPWQPGDEDTLRRSGFACRVAGAVSANVENGLVVGIYGPWGDGKTSVLRMVEASLQAESCVVLWFNPWHFHGQDQLIAAYFAQLAAVLSVRLASRADEIKATLKRYGELLSLVPLDAVLGVDPGKILTAVSDQMAGSDLRTLRDRLDTVLREQHASVVVFIDDVDRLDRTEIHAVLKLVKLVANFRRVTYILACDDAMVAEAIGTAYGAGDHVAGRHFLEKIVQVPLRLPIADAESAKQLVLGEVKRALDASGVALTQNEINEFRLLFDPLFLARRRTLRVGKQYGNALRFALPLLAGEARVVDVLLIELLHAFAPRLHAALPSRRAFLLGEDGYLSSLGTRGNRKQDAEAADWAALVELVDGTERAAVTAILEALFPTVQRVTRNVHYGGGGGWYARWARAQTVVSTHYFDRYFQYAVPPGDVADTDVRVVLAALADGNLDAAQQGWSRAVSPGNLRAMIRKLRFEEAEMSASAARTLIRLLTERAAEFPAEDSPLDFDAPLTQAAVLASNVARRLSVQERLPNLRQLVEPPAPLAFAAECVRFLRHGENDDQEARLIPADEETQLLRTFVERLEQENETSPLHLRDTTQSVRHLLYLWRRYGRPGRTREYYAHRLASHPQEAVPLLHAVASHAVSLNTGMPLAPRIDREDYDSIAALLDVEVLVNALRRAHGERLVPAAVDEHAVEVEHEDLNERLDPELRLARRFIWLHDKVTAELAPTTEKAVHEEGDVAISEEALDKQDISRGTANRPRSGG